MHNQSAHWFTLMWIKVSCIPYEFWDVYYTHITCIGGETSGAVCRRQTECSRVDWWMATFLLSHLVLHNWRIPNSMYIYIYIIYIFLFLRQWIVIPSPCDCMAISYTDLCQGHTQGSASSQCHNGLGKDVSFSRYLQPCIKCIIMVLSYKSNELALHCHRYHAVPTHTR